MTEAQAAYDVLVVENDLALREVLARLLTVEGYRVSAASDGLAAIATLRSQGAPRLIVLDLLMPRMGGEAFLRECRETPSWASVPVLVLTSSLRPALSESLGVATVLTKPPTLKVFLNTVRSLCPL